MLVPDAKPGTNILLLHPRDLVRETAQDKMKDRTACRFQ